MLSNDSDQDDSVSVGRSTPKVSVCLLTYNHEHMLGPVLESVLAQTYRDFEFIVSDDCSTDGTWHLIQSVKLKDSGLRAVRTPRNLGMAGNANFATSFASGEYIALLHHDDVVSPSLLEKWVAVAQESDGLGFVFNDYDVGGTASHLSAGKHFSRHMEGRKFLSQHLLRNWGCPVRGTALIHRARFEAVGKMRVQYSMLADIDLWMRMAARWDVGYVAEPLMRIAHSRPLDYPVEYREFTWKCKKILFEIHAANVSNAGPGQDAGGRVAWWAFRTRVSLEAAKWLIYALVRRKHAMLSRAAEGENGYEWWPVRALRRVLATAGRRTRGRDEPVSASEAQGTVHDDGRAAK